MKDEMLDSADYADNLEVLLRRERAKTARLNAALASEQAKAVELAEALAELNYRAHVALGMHEGGTLPANKLGDAMNAARLALSRAGGAR